MKKSKIALIAIVPLLILFSCGGSVILYTYTSDLINVANAKDNIIYTAANI